MGLLPVIGPVGGAIIKGLAPLLGGLFGKKKKTKTPADNIMSQVKGARDAAAAYGFNPLTVLGATAGPGYQFDNSASLSSGAFISEALSGAVDTYFNETRENREFELAQQAMQGEEAARQLQRQNPFQNFGYGLTQDVPFNSEGTSHAGETLANSWFGVPYVSGANSGRGLGFGGVGLHVGDGTTAQVAEDEYGDLFGSVYGFGRLANDLGENLGRRAQDIMVWGAPKVAKAWRSFNAPGFNLPATFSPPAMANPANYDANGYFIGGY